MNTFHSDELFNANRIYNPQTDFDSIVDILAREAARKINAISSQLSSTMQNIIRSLKAEAGRLESELKVTTESFENARMWRENVLSGCPVLFEQTGLIYTLKPFGTLKRKADKLAEGVTETAAAAELENGHDAGKGKNNTTKYKPYWRLTLYVDLKESSSQTAALLFSGFTVDCAFL